MEYLVKWAIDVEAGSPEEAAQKALEIQRDPTSTATVFEVESDMSEDRIDLPNPEPAPLNVEWMCRKANLDIVWMDGMATVVRLEDMETFVRTVIAQEHAYEQAQYDILNLMRSEMLRLAPGMRTVDMKTSLDLIPFFMMRLVKMERAGSFSHIKTEDLK